MNIQNKLAIPPDNRFHQRGAVLIVALVLLTVLTFIAVTALNTSGMEEKMAGNTQESLRAFHTAETGLSRTFADSSMFVLTEDAALLNCPTGSGTQVVLSNVGDYLANTTVCTGFLMWTAPPRGSGYSASTFSAAHFEMTSVGETVSKASASIHAGAYQIAPGGS